MFPIAPTLATLSESAAPADGLFYSTDDDADKQQQKHYFLSLVRKQQQKREEGGTKSAEAQKTQKLSIEMSLWYGASVRSIPRRPALCVQSREE